MRRILKSENVHNYKRTRNHENAPFLHQEKNLFTNDYKVKNTAYTQVLPKGAPAPHLQLWRGTCVRGCVRLFPPGGIAHVPLLRNAGRNGRTPPWGDRSPQLTAYLRGNRSPPPTGMFLEEMKPLVSFVGRPKSRPGQGLLGGPKPLPLLHP